MRSQGLQAQPVALPRLPHFVGWKLYICLIVPRAESSDSAIRKSTRQRQYRLPAQHLKALRIAYPAPKLILPHGELVNSYAFAHLMRSFLLKSISKALTEIDCKTLILGVGRATFPCIKEKVRLKWSSDSGIF